MSSEHQREVPGLLDLFFVFFKIGTTAFGGPAMIAHVRKKLVDKEQWMEASTYDSGVALCQAIPGAIIMQVAAYCGLKIRGIPGALVAFIAFGLPAFLLMLLLSVLYKMYHQVSWIEGILFMLRVALTAIVAHAAFLFGKNQFRQIYDVMIALVASVLFLIKLHPALVILSAAILGIILPSKSKKKYGSTGISRTFVFFLTLLGLLALSLVVMWLVQPELFTLSTLMLRIDLYSFGGGLAALPIMYHEFVDLYGWFDHQTFTDGIVLGQVTPGSIIITATFAGYLHDGLIGALIATMSVFTPSFLILMAIVPFYDRLGKSPYFNRIVNGILCAFVGLLAVVTWHFANGLHWDTLHVIFALLVFTVLYFRIDVIWVILASIVFAIFLH